MAPSAKPSISTWGSVCRMSFILWAPLRFKKQARNGSMRESRTPARLVRLLLADFRNHAARIGSSFEFVDEHLGILIVAFVVEAHFGRYAFKVLRRPHRIPDLLAGRQLAPVVLDALLDGGKHDRHRIIGINRVAFRSFAEFRLVAVRPLFVGLRYVPCDGAVQGAGDIRSGDVRHAGGIQRVAAHERGRDPFVLRLFHKQGAFGVHSSEEDEIRLLALDGRQHAVEILLTDRYALIPDDGCSRFLGRIPESFGQSLAVSRLVLNDEDVFGIQRLHRVLGSGRALEVVARDDAVGHLELAVGELRRRAGGRDHRQIVFFIDDRGGNGNAGIQMADDAHDGLVGADLLGVGDTLFGIALVVIRDQLKRKAQLGELVLVVVERQLGSELDRLSLNRASARQRRLRSDLDDLSAAFGPALLIR
ncbi:hypothetical protein BN871_BC_00210 [Paenibacillus sp. P22]|nr:hypothetical protein BN871_BC_00210 [Paenibacillus sp. P22]